VLSNFPPWIFAPSPHPTPPHPSYYWWLSQRHVLAAKLFPRDYVLTRRRQLTNFFSSVGAICFSFRCLLQSFANCFTLLSAYLNAGGACCARVGLIVCLVERKDKNNNNNYYNFKMWFEDRFHIRFGLQVKKVNIKIKIIIIVIIQSIIDPKTSRKHSKNLNKPIHSYKK